MLGHPSPRKKAPIQKQCAVCPNTFSVKPSLDRVKCCSIGCANKLRPHPIKGKRLPKQWRDKLRGPRYHTRGVNSWKWIADRSLLKDDNEERNSVRHREWARHVKNRDYWKCQISNDDCSGRVEAHHILGWKSHPELRYEIKNGITLCLSHHPRKRSEEERYAPMFQELVAAKMQ